MTTVNDNYPKSNPVSDEQLKEFAVQQYAQAQVRQHNFHTEVVSLPSQGKVYPANNPLSSGQIEMKYMTAREEDILTSANLIRQGIVLDKLMQSMIVSPINYNDLIIGDKNAIMIAARVLGYGKDYEIDVACPNCLKKNSIVVDLTKLPEKNIAESAKQVSTNLFEFTLPQSKRVVTFKLLTHGDEKAIQAELDSLKKSAKKDTIDKELSTRLRHAIQSVDGESERKYIADFVENQLLAMDSKALRKYIKETAPDQKFEIEFVCEHCDHVEEALAFSIGTTFFWPNN
jgi:hypothetical protein